MQFGNDDGATYNIDPLLNEAEAPPPTPGFDAVFKSIPGHSASNNWGRGLLGNDMRPVPTNALLKDTFQVNFTIADQPDSNIYMEWPDPTYLAARCDSMFMVYLDVNLGGNQTVNMFTQSSIVFPAAGTNSFGSIKIYKYGVKKVDTEVKQENPAVPSSFKLNQNFPNPFNPTTNIKFDIQKSSVVEVAVFNVLGQKVATLVAGQLTPGTYSTQWNGTADNGMAVASGVYFARMSARTETASEPFVALRKLLLMK
jgi:hypothetical protein